MKHALILLTVIALPLIAAQTITISVTLSDDQVWALTQDYEDYIADTNNVPMTKLQWFSMNCTNQIQASASRRLQVRKQQHLQSIVERWGALTPAQQSNVVAALPSP